jgi:hypothetical protein
MNLYRLTRPQSDSHKPWHYKEVTIIANNAIEARDFHPAGKKAWKKTHILHGYWEDTPETVIVEMIKKSVTDMKKGEGTTWVYG